MNRTERPPRGYFSEAGCDIAEFADLVVRDVHPRDVPLACETTRNIPVYDMQALAPMFEEAESRRRLMAEWARVLRSGAGVLVLRRAIADTGVIDGATALFEAIIARERAGSGGGADHFAAAGSNDRIWNSLQKLCEADPDLFLRYHGNPAVDAVCEAWLGPGYQMTAQVNLVHPGGAAQQVHRDYHLGFQTADACALFPAHVHEVSPLLTLQGGIAHGPTPVDSGATRLLPFSQLYRPGYLAWRRADFRRFFELHHAQVPLEKGDALFFNPALFHAAGANTTTDVHRMVNLLQVSSPFGRAMESVDRAGMCRRILAPLQRLAASGELSARAIDAAIAATAEAYPFPTNLDSDPPLGGLAPRAQADLLREALAERWSDGQLAEALAALDARRGA
jgi:ectoine hydroxylase-related dioxygenase (phytanoyl-CoA dioxygenase family)